MKSRVCLVLVLLPQAALADDPLRLRLESAAGIDSNITRREDAAQTGGPLMRLVLDAADELRQGSALLGVEYHAGARHFPEHSAEDGVFQSLSGRLVWAPVAWLAVGLQARLQDRTTRDSADPQDHARVQGGPQVDLRLDAWRLSLAGIASRLAYKPDADFSADGLGATATLARSLGRWRAEARVGWLQHTFDGDRLALAGTGPEGAPFLVPVGGEHREDTLRSGSLGLHHGGDWLAGLEYSVAGNASNSFRAGHVRHLVRATTTLELPFEVVASAQLDLQRVLYDDPQFITLDTFIEDENRSSFKLRLERPLSERWSAVGHLGVWFSPFGGGPGYDRQLALLGLACNLEDPEQR